MDLGEAVLDEFRRVTDGDVRQQVKINRYAGKLVVVIDRLRADDLFCRCYGAQWHEIGCRAGGSSDGAPTRIWIGGGAAGVTADVKIVEIGRLGALVVFHFEDDLILVLRLFNQIDVILRVSSAQET